MTKSADAFRTISEVADELELQKHVLRFWEVKFPQIKPMKRGGGRRYYRPSDLELLRGIRHLLHSEGYTIKGVQRIIREKGVDAVKRASLAAGGDAKRRDAGDHGNGALPDDAARARALPIGSDAATGGAPKRGRGGRAARAAAGAELSAAQQKALVKVIEELQACRDELTPDESPILVAEARSNRATG